MTEMIRRLAIPVVALVLTFVAGGAVQAQGQAAKTLTLSPYPVAVYDGSCAQLGTYITQIGTLLPRPAYEDEDAYEDEVVYENDTVTEFEEDDFYEGAADEPLDDGLALLDEDLNDDGILANDEDLDADGLVDYGLDLNADGVLDAEEVFDYPVVWTWRSGGDLNDLEAEVNDLRASPHAIVLLDSPNGNVVSCGDIFGVADQSNEVVVPLRPMTASGLSGMGELEQGDDGFLGISDDSGEIEVFAWPSLGPIQGPGQPPATPAGGTPPA